VRTGTAALDGIKIHAGGGPHSALSHEHAGMINAQLKVEEDERPANAEAAHQTKILAGPSIPKEPARQEGRIEKPAASQGGVDTRTDKLSDTAMEEHRAKLAARATRATVTSEKPAGSPTPPRVKGACPTVQINLTDDQ
jgi:hypothetical protein